jgi:hypothetical protein
MGPEETDNVASYTFRIAPALSYDLRIGPAFLLYGAACLLVALMAFPLRERTTARVVTLVLFLVFDAVHGLTAAFDPPGGLPRAIPVGLAVVGLSVVAGQLCARLTPTASATARLWIGVLIGAATVDGWVGWRFSPWLLGGWAGVGGAALIVLGESKGLRDPDSRSRTPGSVV